MSDSSGIHGSSTALVTTASPHCTQDRREEEETTPLPRATRCGGEPAGKLSGAGIRARSHLFHVICTTSFSMSSARPFSRGSAIMVILFLVRKDVGNEEGRRTMGRDVLKKRGTGVPLVAQG